MNSTTGPVFRGAGSSSGWRWRRQARTSTSPAGRKVKAAAKRPSWLFWSETTSQPFAPPFLKEGDVLIGQTAAILLYLGDRHGLAPRDEVKRLWVHQIQLTIADLVGEVHDTHHPLSGDLFYEDQKPEALRRAKSFREERIPKFLRWFERILARNPEGAGQLVGSALTYADLSLFQIVEGLVYAFPGRMQRTLREVPRLAALRQAIAQRPRFAPISTAIATSHSTSKGYSVTIPSLMGKATSQIRSRCGWHRYRQPWQMLVLSRVPPEPRRREGEGRWPDESRLTWKGLQVSSSRTEFTKNGPNNERITTPWQKRGAPARSDSRHDP
jgi:glutathione S-transferase